MRINKYLAQTTGLARRAADQAISQGRVQVNGRPAQTGQDVTAQDQVTLDGKTVSPPAAAQTVMLNKPPGYVVSRDGQGSPTMYDLLPPQLHHLKPVGRLDRDSSGLLLLTNDGQLTQALTHPSRQKNKIYEVKLAQPLALAHQQKIQNGVALEDGPSRLQLKPLDATRRTWQVTMHEGRNRQIRRTFAALGYTVTKLHRTEVGGFRLANLASGNWQRVSPATPQPERSDI